MKIKWTGVIRYAKMVHGQKTDVNGDGRIRIVEKEFRQHFFGMHRHRCVRCNYHIDIASIWIESTQCQRTVNIETNKILMDHFLNLSFQLINHFLNIWGTVFPIITHVETPFKKSL